MLSPSSTVYRLSSIVYRPLLQDRPTVSANLRVTAPKRKRLGFKGMPPHPTHSGLYRLEATLKNVDRRIPIPIHHQPTMRAGMGAVAQSLLNQFATGRTHFGRIAGVHQDDRSASFCRFADGHPNKLRPRYIHNAFTHPTAFAHFLGRKLFKHDHLIAVDQLAAFLMREVAASGSDPLVDLCQNDLLFGVLNPVLRLFRGIFSALDTFEVGFITAIQARITDLLTVGERCKGGQSNIHADNRTERLPRLCFNLTRESCIPLASTSA